MNKTLWQFAFYLNKGFEIISRDEFDAAGRPFPVLHLKLKYDRK